MLTTRKPIGTALLVSVRTPKVSELEADESLAELERLVTTLGYRVIATQRQNRPSTSGATLVGEGKLKELARFTGGRGFVERDFGGKKSKAAEKRASEADDDGEADSDESPENDSFDTAAEAALLRARDRNIQPLDPEASEDESPDADESLEAPDELATAVIFDCDLSPSQLRNLENALGAEVIDRTGVIISIFSRHANTRAARLQVEIARLNYLAPRLRETGGASERQAGRGAGESDLEIDRRKIRDRLTELKTELAGVQLEQTKRRSQRSEQPCVALVGYTNAGKSSTMRALTGSQVLVEDKLFATLDTTVRAMQPETHPRILVSDTVGFIKKLPHDLVASFKSTLDEAHNASLLLYVVDSADPTFREQLEVTRDVLREVGVDENAPGFIVLNKSDQLGALQKAALKREFPEALIMSTRSPEDIKALRERILAFFEQDMSEEEILVRYDVPGLMGEIRNHMRVVSESFENEGARLKVRAKASALERLKKKFGLS